MRVRVLGCGGSSGTPALDWGWGRCDPDNPRNRRLRPSILVEEGATRILVDTSPDLRQQLLEAQVDDLDAVVLTHYHADHLHGIDDLRPINRLKNGPIDLFGDPATLQQVRERFGYVLEPLADGAGVYYKPTLTPHEVHDREVFRVGSIEVSAFVQDHGYCESLGLRFGPVAYSTDVVNLPDHAFAMLDGIKIWIVGVLARDPHPTHAHLAKALDWIARVKPERAYLTHLSGLFDYAALLAELPSGVEPAFDGLIIEYP
ncbi:MAG: MBL fold metallo-hydrolase [Magnetospirillum sp. WYHS-4]